ncbi:triose phosphate/3-phosphoglycerate/phosphate translocator [Geranomyces variabilis]|nr:triose phosphate/3-phosphoglycerate/phosphate translocator [Geranomyces variabilis]
MTVFRTAPAIAPPAGGAHPAVYIGVWMSLSSSVILFNKYILFEGGFPYPIFLTTWHLLFATLATRALHRTTNLLSELDGVHLDRTTYWTAIVPIGALFSTTLIFSNLAYLHLSVAFIQMLKATTPVAVLLLGWAFGTEKPNTIVLRKVLVIVFGVALASYGEINLVFIGVIFQGLGIIFEAARLVMVQKLLHHYKMNPLCSLYHFAPVCAVMNGIACLIFEAPSLNVGAFATIGPSVLLANASVAFCLNCAVVFLIGKTSSLVLCLAGIAKDIILVAISSILWATPIGDWQVIGYSIALVGMMWYKNPSFFSGRLGISSVQRTRKLAVIAASVVMIATTLLFLRASDGISPSEPSCLLSDTKHGPPRMVVVAQHGEDSAWLPAVHSSPVIVYEKIGTNRSAEHVVSNYGNEASTFMSVHIEHCLVCTFST